MQYKKINIVLLLSIIVIVIFSLSTFFSMYSLEKLISENDKIKSINYANDLSAQIDSIFAKPKAVAQSIDNSIICNYVEHVDAYTEAELSQIFMEYLSDVIKRHNCDTTFIVPKSNLHCYTEHGYSYYVDPEDDDNIWFGQFLSSGLEYELNLDNDQANNNNITIYVNIRMDDDFGEPIGACGVGIPLQDVLTQLNEIELLDGYKVDFVSKTGKIQLSSDSEFQKSMLENDLQQLRKYIPSDVLDEIKTYNRNIRYKYIQKDKRNSYMIRFLDDFQWYLVISYTAPRLSKSSYILMQNLFVFLICLALLLFISGLGINKYHFKIKELKTKTEIDSLTGILNRYAFEERKRALKELLSLEDIDIVVIDINSLKRINDTYGHEAGDEVIQYTAKMIKKFFSPYGRTYRTGGDEFISILDNFETSAEDLENKANELKNFAQTIAGTMQNRLSISVGTASGKMYQYASFEKLVQIADKKMYEDKKRYYQNNAKDRRDR